MNRNTLILAILAFIVVALATPFQVLGLPLAPIAALVIGAYAGWRTARFHVEGAASWGAKAGAIVGIGALLGSIVVLVVLATALGSQTGIQEYIRASEPHPEARIPVEAIAPLAAAGGALTGLLLGLGDLVLSAIGGLFAAVIYNRQHPAGV